MTPREQFIQALRCEPLSGRVPTFELVFYLTMESIGRVHPLHRQYSQWDQMSARERALQLDDMADCYLLIAEKYHHSAIFVHPNPSDYASTVALLTRLRERSGGTYYLTMHGDPTFSIPDGDSMLDFTAQLYEEPEALKQQAARQVAEARRFAERLQAEHPGLLDGFTLCSDYCFNTNPFFSPAMFGEFIAPYLQEIVAAYHAMGYRVIKHTDGNILPILDQIAQCGPDALHSLDPQGGVSLPEVRRRTHGRLALCGNVNCGLLQTGSDEACDADVRRSLREGMAAPGYIFCTSNCAYTGMPLARYERMNRIWWEEGRYPDTQTG